jgi:hypothetical protein
MPRITNRSWRVAFDDPPSMVRVAQQRTRFMLIEFRAIDFDLHRLVVSAYLQGVRDTALVAFNQGFVPPGCEFIDRGDGI